MLNDLISGISIKLNAAFGDGYKIYTNDVKQGLKEPCFFVAVLEPTRKQIIGRRIGMTILFALPISPDTPGTTLKCWGLRKN